MCNHSHVLYIAYIHIYILTNTHIIGCPSKDSPIWPIKLPVVLVALISSQNVDLFCLVIKSTCFWIRLLLSIFEHLLLLTYLFWYITKQNYYILLLRVVIDFGFLVWTGKKRGTLQYEYFAAIESRNSTSNESNWGQGVHTVCRMLFVVRKHLHHQGKRSICRWWVAIRQDMQ